ncbi:hypothetical protein [Arenicella xantha]|uniref:Killing trait domain-containing protein n=1 Tax=Arenicella xantha TaxID=644221 RepID=A0A395JNN5_9GAMM|nr:hypothetical protein [Arenicella xantha]RBP53107.1 hypothetical protein DFR28_101492 [Arenicella xantha]
MNDITKVNPQILNSIEAVQQASMTGTVISHSGAGKAYQSVAQSTAIAIQDATDTLRNFNTIGTTAAGVAVAQMIATSDTETFGKVMAQINTMLTDSATNFKTVGDNASNILESFPTGG